MRNTERALITNIVPLQGSGSGTYAEQIAVALQKRDIEVTVVVAGNPQTNADIDVTSIGYEDGNFPVFTTHPHQNVLKRFKDMSRDEEDVYIKKWRDEITKKATEFSPDAAHLGHAWVIPEITREILYTQRQTPIVTTIHGPEIIGVREDPYGRFAQLAYKGQKITQASIATTSHIQQEAHKTLGIPLEKLPISPNGFNPDIFSPDPSLDKESVLDMLGLEKLAGSTIIYTSGKFAQIKRHDRAIGAIAKTLEEIPDVHLIHAGDGDEKIKMELLQYAHDLGVSEHIHFVGQQPQKVLNKIANISNIAIFVSDFEAFGLVALEAQATGTPVVTTNCGGFSDFVDDTVGRIVQPTEDAVAQAIISELKTNSKIKKGPVAACHARSFTWDRHIEPIIEIWDKARYERANRE